MPTIAHKTETPEKLTPEQIRLKCRGMPMGVTNTTPEQAMAVARAAATQVRSERLTEILAAYGDLGEYAYRNLRAQTRKEVVDLSDTLPKRRAIVRNITLDASRMIRWEVLQKFSPSQVAELKALATPERPIICPNPPCNREPKLGAVSNAQLSVLLNDVQPVPLVFFSIAEWGDHFLFPADGAQRCTAYWRENLSVHAENCQIWHNCTWSEGRALFILYNSGKFSTGQDIVSSSRATAEMWPTLAQPIPKLLFYSNTGDRRTVLLPARRGVRGGTYPKKNDPLPPLRLHDAIWGYGYVNVLGNTITLAMSGELNLRDLNSLDHTPLVDHPVAGPSLVWTTAALHVALCCSFYEGMRNLSTTGLLQDVPEGMTPQDFGILVQETLTPTNMAPSGGPPTPEQKRAQVWVETLLKTGVPPVKNGRSTRAPWPYTNHRHFLLAMLFIARHNGIGKVLRHIPMMVSQMDNFDDGVDPLDRILGTSAEKRDFGGLVTKMVEWSNEGAGKDKVTKPGKFNTTSIYEDLV